jgi:S-adenosylmethionine decarboxylase
MVDATGCDPLKIGDIEIFKKLFNTVVHDLHLQPVGEAQWKKFPPPGGVTGLLMLRESHLCCHTFPEHHFAAINLYCCKPRDAWPWEQKLPQLIGAKQVIVRQLARGLAPSPP